MKVHAGSALLVTCMACAAPAVLHAQAPGATVPGASQAPEELIVSIRANGVRLGDYTVVRTADGDIWVQAVDLPRLQIRTPGAGKRSWEGLDYYSLRELAVAAVRFDEPTLSVDLDFPTRELRTTRIDLSGRPPRGDVPPSPTSAILNYRATARHSEQGPLQLRLTTDLNVRMGEVLLRQEAKVETGRPGVPSFARGVTQVIWDDRTEGRRVIAGDQLTAGGPFGSVIPVAGISLTKLYAITPDVLRYPAASFQISTSTPSQVEVAIDGNTIHRTSVSPGPVSVENLFYYNGLRNLRVTVVDATGQRQVYEQPFLFTDTVLAKGLHEYSYFAGRRAELGGDDRWRYREAAWHGFHRYGASDSVTLEAGAEGNDEFASGGAGIALRSDTLGLLAVGALGSVDRRADRSAHGWSARYSYTTPTATLFAARRQLEPGFRTFFSGAGDVQLLTETRVGASTRLFSASSMSADFARIEETVGTRHQYALRLSSSFDRRSTFYAEYTHTRQGAASAWGVNLWFRYTFDSQHSTGALVRTAEKSHTLEVDASKLLPQGEGVGYRVGTTLSRTNGADSDFAFGSVAMNLRPVTLDASANVQTRGGNARFAEVGVSGALVSVDGYVGAARPVPDGFALARLGVPQAGVEVSLNNQVQGRTDADGNLLIPNVGAFGRQDVSLNDKQLGLEYTLDRKRVTIAPAYRSGSLVSFGGQKLRAVTGRAWVVQGGARKPVDTRAWGMSGAGGRLRIETVPSGEFYLENAAPGRYTGRLDLGGKSYACVVNIPDFAEAVHELQDGVVCE